MSMTRSDALLLGALISVRDNERLRKSSAICGGIIGALRTEFVTKEEYTAIRRKRDKLFVQWPDYSGQICFPVPSGLDFIGPSRAYNYALQDGELWSISRPYGRNRWDLLYWMIDQLQKEHNEDLTTS